MFLEGVEWFRFTQIIIAAILFRFTTQTHFRGAQFWFTALPDEGAFVVDINFRIAWRRNFSSSTYCDQTTIESEKLIGPATAGYIVCDVGDCKGESLSNVRFRCTDFSDVEDWTVGVNHVKYTFPGPGYYELVFKGQGWLNGSVHAHDARWEQRVSMNLDLRPDTRRINSSPKSAVSPIVRMQESCEHAIHIPVSDDDDDVVRCRWAEGSRDECGEICDSFKNTAYLEESTCILRYGADDQLGSYAVAIQVEDYIDEDAEEPLSSVPVQFIIYVYPSVQPCDEAPQFIDPTPDDGSCITSDVDTPHTSQVVVRAKDQFTSIREISTVSLVGMRKSDVKRYGDDPRDYYVTITWTPREIGESIFCFSARDSNDISTEQRCISFLVGMPPLLATQAEAEEVGDLMTIQVHFNQQIQRPSQTHSISLRDAEDNGTLTQLDTANDTLVTFYTLSITFNATNMEAGRGYYILMPEGAVRGTRRCGADSIEVSEPSKLAFIAPGSPPTTPADPTTAEPSGGSSTQTLVSTQSSTTSSTTLEDTQTTDDDTNDVSTERITPAPVKDDDDESYLWIILVILMVILLVTLVAILVGLVLARKKYKRENSKYPEEIRDEEFVRHLKNMGVYNNSYQTEAVDPGRLDKRV